MKSLWSDAEAAQFTGALGPRVYTSRLLGRDRSLVLHGGGNTSVKLRERNLFGEDEDVPYGKGSGWGLRGRAPRGKPATLVVPRAPPPRLTQSEPSRPPQRFLSRRLTQGVPPPCLD